MISALPQVSELIGEPDCINEVLEILEAALDQLDAMDYKVTAIHLHQAIETLRPTSA